MLCLWISIYVNQLCPYCLSFATQKVIHEPAVLILPEAYTYEQS